MSAPFYCSPLVRNCKTGSCLDRQGLLHYIRLYNRHHANQIHLNGYHTDAELVELINNNLEPCQGKGDWCWADQHFAVDDPIIQSRYKPKIPRTRYQWLKTTDIDKVIRPYEEIYPDFKYLATVPLDFDKLRNFRLSYLNYCTLYNKDGKRKIGAVFNLDTSDKRGSHWVSMFADLDKHYVAFFDSVGVRNPPREITLLMNSIKRQIERCAHHRFNRYVANNVNLKVNRRNIQKGNTECGVFCIYFILKCLEGATPDEIFDDPYLSDRTVNYFRGKIFRPSIDSDNEVFSDQGLELSSPISKRRSRTKPRTYTVKNKLNR